MTDGQSLRGNHADETPTDAITWAIFRLRLAALEEKLFRHYLQELELRALFHANYCNKLATNTEVWLIKYQEREWSVLEADRSVPFRCYGMPGLWRGLVCTRCSWCKFIRLAVGRVLNIGWKTLFTIISSLWPMAQVPHAARSRDTAYMCMVFSLCLLPINFAPAANNKLVFIQYRIKEGNAGWFMY